MAPTPSLHLRRGLTIVDAAIALGITLIAIALLLPLIESQQNIARTQRCAENLRLIMAGVHRYAAIYRQAIPGSPWTSSAHLREEADFADPSLIPSGVTKPFTPSAEQEGPVALFDWMTPIAEVLNLPNLPPRNASARDRYLALVNHPMLRCPANNITAFPTGDLTFPITRPPSYRTNLDFLLRSSAFSSPSPSALARYVSVPWAQLPPYYRPVLDNRRIGNLSKKIYLLEGAGVIDGRSTKSTYPSNFIVGESEGGALATPRPYAYRLTTGNNALLLGNLADRTQAPDPDRENWLLLATARHGTSSTNAPLTSYTFHVAFFDGHAERLDVLEALDPKLHSPPGTQVDTKGRRVYPRVAEHYFKGRQDGFWTVP